MYNFDKLVKSRKVYSPLVASVLNTFNPQPPNRQHRKALQLPTTR